VIHPKACKRQYLLSHVCIGIVRSSVLLRRRDFLGHLLGAATATVERDLASRGQAGQREADSSSNRVRGRLEAWCAVNFERDAQMAIGG